MDRPLFAPDGEAARPLFAVIAAYRHSITLCLILGAHLLAVGLVGTRAEALSPMILLVMYLVGFLLLCERNTFSLGILAMGGIALVASMVSVLERATPMVIVAVSLHCLFDALLIVFTLVRLFKLRKMPFDTIMAGIIAFLFMAGLWSQLYGVLELASPGALRGPTGEGLGTHPLVTLYYFSVITLTSAGYGDVVPVSDMARILAAYEALIGQVYLAVFIALLIGRHFSAPVKPPVKAEAKPQE